MKKLAVLGMLVVLTLGLPVFTKAYMSPGKPIGYVNDFAGMLSDATKQQLEAKLTTISSENGAQITIVTVKTIGNDTIENYAVKLFEDWGIGKKGKDNGILLLIAKDDRKMKIEVGYGLEGDLTDAQSSWIIRQTLTPAFREERYDEGVLSATNQIIGIVTKSAPLPTDDGNRQKESPPDIESVIGFLVFGGFLLQWLGSILARTKSWWLGGFIGGIIALIATLAFGFMVVGLVAFGTLVPLGLLLDYIVSKQYRESVKTDRFPWWIGGRNGFGGGFGGGHGGGFGGFGGGRSGGGGASGSW